MNIYNDYGYDDTSYWKDNIKHSFCWDRFLKEGDNLFNYMIYHFNYMIDRDNIKHFSIRSGIYGYTNEVDNIIEKYNIPIQKELIVWIKKELENNQLYKEKHWKPFRDQYLLTSMYLGYRKLFMYENYYFQLIIFPNCDNFDICYYCENNESSIHFELALIGWKTNEINNISSYIINLSDNIINEIYWKKT